MQKIQVLDETTIDQIAAGEVVERPSSVVKELVENAIDAGASAITVEIKDGGTSLIRITDNGCGIDPAQIPIAFLRHSTSKIRSVSDLLTISSLGFRGEALSSIASVAQVELITKTADSFVGSRYLIEGGKEIALEEVGAPDGTTFLVKNLFYNTPARRKFLKTPQTEAGYISDLMERIALSHPEISFRLINNGQLKLHTSGNGELKDIIYHIYGREIAANLLPIHGSFAQFSVDGFIGKPVISRGNRNFESYFLNGRYIKSTLIAKAIEDAYHGFVMQHKYPFVVLIIRLDGSLVDVNVHPNKMELRFSDGEQLYQQLAKLIHDTLRREELIADVTLERKEKETYPAMNSAHAPEPFETNRLAGISNNDTKTPGGENPHPIQQDEIEKTVQNLCEEKTLSKSIANNSEIEAAINHAPSSKSAFPQMQNDNSLKASAYDTNDLLLRAIRESTPEFSSKQVTLAEYAKEDAPLLSEQAKPKHRVIGQLFGTYWLLEYGDRFYLIDQHAAHEKVLYEQLLKRYRNREVTSQLISPPMIVSLTMQEEQLLSRHLSVFAALGYTIEPFGGREYAISAVPANLYGLDERSVLTELIDGLSELSEKDTPELLLDKLASMSCKAAVKGNHKLSEAEINRLLDDLLQLENPYFCPHGRPVIVSMTKYEIEKKFKRIV